MFTPLADFVGAFLSRTAKHLRFCKSIKRLLYDVRRIYTSASHSINDSFSRFFFIAKNFFSSSSFIKESVWCDIKQLDICQRGIIQETPVILYWQFYFIKVNTTIYAPGEQFDKLNHFHFSVTHNKIKNWLMSNEPNIYRKRHRWQITQLEIAGA